MRRKYSWMDVPNDEAQILRCGVRKNISQLRADFMVQISFIGGSRGLLGELCPSFARCSRKAYFPLAGVAVFEALHDCLDRLGAQAKYVHRLPSNRHPPWRFCRPSCMQMKPREKRDSPWFPDTVIST
jgi:hypothetical protein